VTKGWSNDAENSALITGINNILKYIHTGISYFKTVIIFHKITVFALSVFTLDQINAASVSRRHSFPDQ